MGTFLNYQDKPYPFRIELGIGSFPPVHFTAHFSMRAMERVRGVVKMISRRTMAARNTSSEYVTNALRRIIAGCKPGFFTYSLSEVFKHVAGSYPSYALEQQAEYMSAKNAGLPSTFTDV